jgi:ATP-dependent RNA helicase DDX5/DBP2
MAERRAKTRQCKYREHLFLWALYHIM